MAISISKIPGGLSVDGLLLKSGRCGCTSILKCCHSFSKVKRDGDVISFTGKTSCPDSEDLYSWGYTVSKDGVTVKVSMDDARDKTIFSGYYPPRLEEWLDRGWMMVEQNGRREDGQLWRCATCKWLYKVTVEGVWFEDLPDDWRCPTCHAGKNAFERIG